MFKLIAFKWENSWSPIPRERFIFTDKYLFTILIVGQLFVPQTQILISKCLMKFCFCGQIKGSGEME